MTSHSRRQPIRPGMRRTLTVAMSATVFVALGCLFFVLINVNQPATSIPPPASVQTVYPRSPVASSSPRNDTHRPRTPTTTRSTTVREQP